jgi:membrane protease subunit HflK
MYLETMQQIYSNTTKVFVDSKSGSNVLYLPLDKLVEQTRQRVAESAAASAASAAQAAQPAQNAQSAQGAQAAAQGGNTPAIITPSAAPVSSASQAAAASDAFRSRDSFRSRGREDDLQ